MSLRLVLSDQDARRLRDIVAPLAERHRRLRRLQRRLLWILITGLIAGLAALLWGLHNAPPGVALRLPEPIPAVGGTLQ